MHSSILSNMYMWPCKDDYIRVTFEGVSQHKGGSKREF